MLRHHQRFYYALKPFLPWALRMSLRRIAARRTRSTSRAIWPINEAAKVPPEQWPGWPEGKRFAVVLTHDVEGRTGLAKCRKLLELERRRGFRSSFNFIPEGDYRVAPGLRSDLVNSGFEIGVHDLRHDGKLFQSRRLFRQNADRINQYLREWGAVGYRSGFMLRNLEWIHDLDIEYDSSTFDTDPFELQPDGAGTIFPFWVPAPLRNGTGQQSNHAENFPTPGSNDGHGRLNPNPARKGYVELPYTLPQDSTLFLVFRETSPDIWLRKLDWIAAHGGMVLVNVHPDYMQFDDEQSSGRTYPATFYSQLLDYLRENYADQYWQALPRDIAKFTLRLERRPIVRRAKRICMVTHSFYESDNRVTRYAEALAARGDHVDVLALRRSPDLPTHETIEGVNVHRLQNRFGKT